MMNRSGTLDNQDDMANDTPEESYFDGFSSNYTSAEAFIHGLASMVNQNDVETMIRAQKQMLQRFEKTNEMISNCNALSQSRLKGANEDFKKHVKLLTDMKKDLDYIFRKVRVVKQKLNQQYPVAYAEAQRSSLAEEADDEGHPRKSTPPSGPTATPTATATSTTPGQLNDEAVGAAATSTTVEYVQMEETIENGKPIENELIKRVCSIETTNPNDSSDCTSEDTG